MRPPWSAALAGAAIMVGLQLAGIVAPVAPATTSAPSSASTAGPALTLTNSDGICSSPSGPCPANTYTLDVGQFLQVDLTGGNGEYWSEPSSINPAVLSLQSGSTDAAGDATATFKVVGAGTADIDAQAQGCPSPPPAGTACPPYVITWEVGFVGKYATAMALAATPNPVVYGQPVTLVATLPTSPGMNPVPTGTVDFYDGVTLLGSSTLVNEDPNGDQATFTVAGLSGGTHQLSANYLGDDTFSGCNTIPILLTIDPAPTTLVATPAVLDTSGPTVGGFALSATLSRSDTGAPVAGQQVAFAAGATPICTAVTDEHGVAVCNGLAQALEIVASQGYTVTFGGTPDYRASSARAGLIS